MSISKLALGTVQFGLDYGISNKNGKIPPSEVSKILLTASRNGVTMLDTANAYGESELVIGQELINSALSFQIITKISSSDNKEIEELFKTSLQRLGQESVYGCLLHDFEAFGKDRSLWTSMERLKEKGKVAKIGFSIYRRAELESLFKKNIRFDILQVPYSILDQRFADQFQTLKDAGVEIHIRSIFLQGLVFIPSDQLDKSFGPLIKNIRDLQTLSNSSNISVAALCLCFAVLNPLVNRVIIGVESEKNLVMNIAALDEISRTKEIYNQLRDLRSIHEHLLLPFKWKIKKK